MLQHQASSQHPGWSTKHPPGELRLWHCEGCGKNFAKWDVLRSHFNYHKRPFQCKECQFAVASVPKLRKHMRAAQYTQWSWPSRNIGLASKEVYFKEREHGIKTIMVDFILVLSRPIVHSVCLQRLNELRLFRLLV